jgi:hypothetical protein
MDRYSVFPGKFPCHTCKSITHSVRLYPDSKKITWMCKDKHLSSISLQTKKHKRDYERKI